MTGQLQRVVLKVNNELYSVVIDDEKAYTTWKDSEDHSTSEMNLFIGDNIFKGKRYADQASIQDLENAFKIILNNEAAEGDVSAKEFLDDDEAEEGEASAKEALDNVKDEANEGDVSTKEFLDDVKRRILLNGELSRGKELESDRNSRNDARGGKAHDTRGSGSQMTGA